MGLPAYLSRWRRDRLGWLGGCLPIFSDVKNAYEARGWVTHGEGRVIRELELAHPHEVFNGELERVLGGDWARAVLDPPYLVFMELAGSRAASARRQRGGNYGDVAPSALDRSSALAAGDEAF